MERVRKVLQAELGRRRVRLRGKKKHAACQGPWPIFFVSVGVFFSGVTLEGNLLSGHPLETNPRDI